MSAKQPTLKEKLEYIIENEPNTIKACVAQEALSYDPEEIETFFSNLQQYGCVSGMIDSLVFYSGTHKFFDTHYDEIEDLRYEYEEIIGESLKVKGDLKNWFAWFTFEVVAGNLADELFI